MRLRPVVAAVACALAPAAPASASFPEAPGERRHPAVERRHPAVERESFAVPLKGPLHSPFGSRWGRVHDGIDIAVLGTDEVRAALPGVVTAVGYLPGYEGYGNVVKLRHARGLATMYAHLASAGVRVGQDVERGQRIARAGCTGSCTGPHLHFEVRVNGRLVDPLRYLEGRVR